MDTDPPAQTIANPLLDTRFLLIAQDDVPLTALAANITRDIHAEFDAVLVLDGVAEDIAALRARSSNPLAPVICGPHATLPHCDLRLEAVTAETIMDAAAKVRSIMKLAASLPALPVDSHRDAITVLGLAFTRGVDIQARWAPDRPEMVSYPLLWSLENSRDLLEELANAKLLRRVFFDCTQYCPHCQSSRLIAREVCTSCSSSHLSETPLIHHYRCGHQGSQDAFARTEAGIVCPKCDQMLRHYGVDYDKPGTVSTCLACNATMSDPAVSFMCIDCAKDSRGETVGKRNWYNYSLLPDGIVALRAGRLPHREFSPRTDSNHAARTTRDFRLLIDQLLPISKRFGRPLTAFRLEIDSAALTQVLGPERACKARELVQETIAQGLRASDFSALLGDGVVAGLPETSREGANVLVEAIRQRLGETFSVPVKMECAVYDADNVHELLESLP